ncbi:alpha/beta-hydrolase [Thozetella sp. PMI_491]|nr:alpha/beta-hydrolase [Thozetella sp. PMI_491]
MSSTNIAIVLVPGACGAPHLYNGFVAHLHAQGFPPELIKVVATPSVGRPSPELLATQAPATMYDDAKAVRSEVEKLADAGHDILLVAHSYGGIPATESVKGATKTARAAEGKTGGIVRLLYTSAVVPKVEGTLSDIVMGTAASPNYLIIEGAYFRNEPEGSAGYNFSDIPHEEAVEWAKKLDWHSAVSFTNPLTYPGYNDVPVTYLFHEEDRTVTPEMQEKCIANIEESSGQKVDVQKIKSGHNPYVSQQENLAKIFADVARKALG